MPEVRGDAEPNIGLHLAMGQVECGKERVGEKVNPPLADLNDPEPV